MRNVATIIRKNLLRPGLWAAVALLSISLTSQPAGAQASPTNTITINLKNEVAEKVRVVVYDHLTLKVGDLPAIDVTLKPNEIRSFTLRTKNTQTRFQSNRVSSSRVYTITQWPGKNIEATHKWYYNAFVRPASNGGTTMKLELHQSQ